MAKFNLRLANPWGMWFRRKEIMDEVAKLFDPVAREAGFDGVSVTATLDRPTVMPGDVLVYLVPNEDFSLIEKAFGEGDRDPAGRTYIDYGASEVYIAGKTYSAHGGGVFLKFDRTSSGGAYFELIREPAVVAKVVFHEVLHNKLKLDDEHLHSKKGPQDALFRRPILPGSKLSKEDKALLVPKLGSPVKQWVNGWDYLPPPPP